MVPATVALRCEMRVGALTLEAAVVDISLGGMGTLFGAVLGAFSYVLLQEWFSALTKHWQLLMGLFIVVAVLLLPQGLIGLHQLRIKSRMPRAERDSD